MMRRLLQPLSESLERVHIDTVRAVYTLAVGQLQVWLQEFAWTEADKPVKLEARSVMVPDNPSLARQPMFCFETMMNLLYWSCFVYDHKTVRTLHRLLSTTPLYVCAA